MSNYHINPIPSAVWDEVLRIRQRAPVISQRTPQRPTILNNADKVERYLNKDGHRIWGWVVYRCTYESDSDWEQFMQRLRYYIRDTLNFDNGLDLMPSLNFHVFDDPALFNGANASTVRQHFRQWAATAPEQEQGAEVGARESQRYEYCIQVDITALRSIIDGPAPPEDNLSDAFVNLIRGEWDSGYDEDDVEHEPIEGCTDYDVGWMRIRYNCLMVDWYCRFRGSECWHIEYRRPPEVGVS